jgi:hypothetical protein
MTLKLIFETISSALEKENIFFYQRSNLHSSNVLLRFVVQGLSIKQDEEECLNLLTLN